MSTLDEKELVSAVAELEILEKELAIAEMSSTLREFIPRAWKWVEPAEFVPNWHIDAICEHLEAVTKGDIKDLLITMPPRHSKSLIISVLWPVWEWITYPQNRWIFASYAFNLSVRDSIKRRGLIQTGWFADHFSRSFTLVKEQNSKVRFANDKNGYMMASSVGGSNTGEGGERIVADDPHNVKKAESEEVRTDTVNWWNVVMSTRRNDAKSVRVVVQQRVHEGDVAGDILERGGYVHLNLPTEFKFSGTSACKTSWTETATGKEHRWEDPRLEEGELLNPIRFTAAQNERAKIDLGDYQYAAQHGQNPTPPSGQIIQAHWLKYYGGPTGIPIPNWSQTTNPMTPLLSIDCSFKEHKDTDFVAGTGWAQFGADLYLMPVVIHARMGFPKTVDEIARFVGGTSLDGMDEYPGIFPMIKIKLVEDRANGSAVISTLQHRIPGIVAYQPGSASKESRLMSASWRFRAGNVYLPHESLAPWIKEFAYQLCAFPKAKYDDFVDSCSQAIVWLGGGMIQDGNPEAPGHQSTWFSLGTEEATLHMDSAWGSMTGTNRSIWRR